MKKLLIFSFLLSMAGISQQTQTLPTGYRPSFCKLKETFEFAKNLYLWKSNISLIPEEEARALRVKRLEEMKRNKLFKALPEEVKIEIISFASNKIKDLILINKEFYNLMLNEKGKVKAPFFSQIAMRNPLENRIITKLFECAYNKNDRLIFKDFKENFEKITEKPLLLPNNMHRITQENLFEIAAHNGFVRTFRALLNRIPTEDEKIARLFQDAYASENSKILNNFETIFEKIAGRELSLPSDNFEMKKETLIFLAAYNGLPIAIESLESRGASMLTRDQSGLAVVMYANLGSTRGVINDNRNVVAIRMLHNLAVNRWEQENRTVIN